MKKFNLEEAKAGKPVCTRDGRPARIICFDKKDSRKPIVALVNTKDGNESLFCYPNNGKFVNDTIPRYDLMMASEKHEGWINLIKGIRGILGVMAAPTINETKEEAERYKYEGYEKVATIHIEWEE